MLPEVQTYVDRLRDRRTEVLRAVQDLELDGLDWKPPVPDTNSLIVLAVHSLGAERQWLHAVIGNRMIERDRDAEFRAHGQIVTVLADLYATAANESEGILAALTSEELDAMRTYRSHTHSVRWCILHVLEHYSEHLGQMWLTRQLYENRRVFGSGSYE